MELGEKIIFERSIFRKLYPTTEVIYLDRSLEDGEFDLSLISRNHEMEVAWLHDHSKGLWFNVTVENEEGRVVSEFPLLGDSILGHYHTHPHETIVSYSNSRLKKIIESPLYIQEKYKDHAERISYWESMISGSMPGVEDVNAYLEQINLSSNHYRDFNIISPYFKTNLILDRENPDTKREVSDEELTELYRQCLTEYQIEVEKDRAPVVRSLDTAKYGIQKIKEYLNKKNRFGATFEFTPHF